MVQRRLSKQINRWHMAMWGDGPTADGNGGCETCFYCL